MPMDTRERDAERWREMNEASNKAEVEKIKKNGGDYHTVTVITYPNGRRKRTITNYHYDKETKTSTEKNTRTTGKGGREIYKSWEAVGEPVFEFVLMSPAGGVQGLLRAAAEGLGKVAATEAEIAFATQVGKTLGMAGTKGITAAAAGTASQSAVRAGALAAGATGKEAALIGEGVLHSAALGGSATEASLSLSMNLAQKFPKLMAAVQYARESAAYFETAVKNTRAYETYAVCKAARESLDKWMWEQLAKPGRFVFKDLTGAELRQANQQARTAYKYGGKFLKNVKIGGKVVGKQGSELGVHFQPSEDGGFDEEAEGDDWEHRSTEELRAPKLDKKALKSIQPEKKTIKNPQTDEQQRQAEQRQRRRQEHYRRYNQLGVDTSHIMDIYHNDLTFSQNNIITTEIENRAINNFKTQHFKTQGTTTKPATTAVSAPSKPARFMTQNFKTQGPTTKHATSTVSAPSKPAQTSAVM